MKERCGGVRTAPRRLARTAASTNSSGALVSLVTSAYRGPGNWNLRQVGVLDGIRVTLIGGGRLGGGELIRHDGPAALSSQLMDDAELPAGVLPADTVRRVFPTVHSKAVCRQLNLTFDNAANENAASVGFLVDTVLSRWRADGLRPATAATNPVA